MFFETQYLHAPYDTIFTCSLRVLLRHTIYMFFKTEYLHVL